ncbi:immunoglobulin-like domain-containing protein [Listeria rocourtiae]|uniref:immunoglobulin-like domain-containing protein n=1 Tax=Listeria rocourtiae TaxID=647910 RepID=UPI003D2F7B8A
MKFEEKGPINVLSKASVKKAAKSLLVATVIASQVFTVLPTGSFAAEATGQESTTPTLPTADQAASKIAIEPMSLALDNGVTEKRAQVSTFAEFAAAAESTTINVIEITGNFQFTRNVSINSNIRIEGNGYSVTAGNFQMIMRSTSIVDVQDLSIANVGTKGVFTGFNSTAAPTVNLTNNVQVFGMIMGGSGKLSLSIGGTNNKIVSPDQYGMDVDDLIIEDNTRIEELSALNTAVKVRSSGAVSIGDNSYINMNSSKGYAFDVSNSALVVGENTVLKSASKYGTVRAATLVVKNGADLTLASGDVGYGIYVTGNITIGDDVKLKATGTGTAVYAYNTGASIVVGKNANVDIVSDNGHGFYGNASITFGDGSSLKLRTQYKGIYSAGAAPIRFGTVSNQPKAAADRVKIDIDSGIDYGIYSAGGPVIFGDDTEVNVKAKAGSIYAGGNSRINFGSNTKTTISSSAGKGIDAGGVVFGDDSTVSINAYVDGINTTNTSGEGLTTGKNVSMNITANNHDGIYTYKNTTFGENNTVVIKALNSHAIHSFYGSAINIGANSSFDLSGTDGIRQEGGAAAALNVGNASTLKIASAAYGIYTTGSATFANNSKANIRAGSKTTNPAVKANGVVTFNKDTMAYVETLSPVTTTSVFDLSGAANSKLVLNSPKFIDFRQNNNDATKKTGHIVKGYGTATVASQSRIEINNVKNLMAWNHGTDWSKASNTAWTDIDAGRVTLSNKNGTATTAYYGGVATGIDGFSLFDYTRLSTEGSSAIDRPTVNPIYVGAKTVSGKGTPGNDIIVTFPNGTTAKTTVKDDGTWTVDVPAGVKLAKDQSVVSYQTNGVNDSANVNTKVQQDLSVPGTPDVAPIKEGDTVLKGKGEPNKEITITLPDGSKVTGNTDANGDFTINIPAQKEDDVLKVTQKGDNGLDSPEVEVIVASNQKPVITADDQTFRVGDTFNPLADVKATDKEDGDITADVKVKSSNVDMAKVGSYTVVYTVTDKDGNTTEKTVTIKVIAATAGTITANEFTIGSDNYVKGIYTGDVAKMYLEVNGVKLTTISATGSPYQYYANGSITKATDQVFIVALDANGKELQKTAVKVNAKVTAGTITAEDYTVGTNYVKGTLTGDVVKAALEVNGVVKQAINVSNPYQYYAKDKVLNATDAVYIIGYDANGKVLQRTKVNVKSTVVTKGTITPANYVLGTDTYVKGTFTGDVAKVSITVNGVVKQTINTPTSPFQYYAKDKIFNLTDIVMATAYDSTGKVLDTKQVTITANNGLPGTITANSFKLGKDSYVTGTRTGDVQKIELVVNGVVQQRIDVTAQPAGTYQYYAKGKILSATDVVTMNAYNAAGTLVNTKTVAISTTDGTVVANTFVLGKDGYVTGTLTGDVTKIALKVNGVLKSAVPKTAGAFEYYAKDKITSVSDVVEVIAYDATGAVLSTATVNVTQQTAPVTVGTVTPQAFKIGTHSYVDGTYTGDVAKVELEVNGTKYGQIPANGNVIHYYAAGLIKDGTDDVKVNVYDATGKLLDSKQVTINVATGTVNANPVKVGDSYLTGTATGDVYKVVLSVNGVLKTSPAFVAADGTYKYFIKDLNLQPTDVVEVVGQDSRGGQINTNTVTITQ